MGGEHVAQRILPFALLFGMLSLRPTRCSYGICPFLVLYLLITMGNWSRVNKVYDEYHGVLRTIPDNARIELVSSKEDMYLGQINVFGHFPFYHHIEKGGISAEHLFNLPPVICVPECRGERWNGEQWAVEFGRLNGDYAITAKPYDNRQK